jgi:multicomponent Na+:H+ antiporter subunit E
VHFLVQSFVGAVDVAWRALHPRCPLTPGTWQYVMHLPPGQGRMLFIGCIGLLPGTVGRDVQGDVLWVHSISGDPQQSLEALERRIAALYGITIAGGDT